MAKHSRALHFKTGNTTDDVTLYTTLGEVVDPAVINADQTTGGAALYTVGTDVSYPALRVRDGNDTVFGALVSPSDKRATNLRVRYNNTTYAVGKTSTLGAYGICYFQQEANGPWTWARVDEDGNPLTENPNFDYIAPWSGIETVVIDGQTMVKIPKFYVKADTIASGTYAGAKARWVSPEKKDGYHIHPAFVKNGFVMDCIYIGAYEASLDANSKASSIAGVTPVYRHVKYAGGRYPAESWDNAIRWRYIRMYDIAAVNYLLLIELGTPDAQTAIARGNVDSLTVMTTGSTPAVYREIHEWWGNATEYIEGTYHFGSTSEVVYIPLLSNNGDNTTVSYTFKAQNNFINELDDTHIERLDLSDLFVASAVISDATNNLIPDKVAYGLKDNYNTPEWLGCRAFLGKGSDAGPFAQSIERAYGDGTTYGNWCTRIAKDGTVTSEVAPNR